MSGRLKSSPAWLRRPSWWRRAVVLAVGMALALAASVAAAAAGPEAGSAAALRGAWTLATGPAAPAPESSGGLRITSSQVGDVLSGRLLGVLDRPFAEVQATLGDPPGWCAVLILDPNIHACRAAGSAVEVALGQRDTPVAFAFARAAVGVDYAHSRLVAAEGPLGTRDYTIGFEAAPLGPGRTLVQLTFMQRFGLAARMAMTAYFTTTGRKKVGFTVVDHDAGGRPVHVGDLRGGIERNLARYFLAIEANAASRGVALAQRPEARVRAWLAGTERYPVQLREAPGYIERKVPEVRQQMSGE